MKIRRPIVYIMLLGGIMLLAQSCSTTKGCGCGTDINRVYKSKRFH